MKFFSFKRGFLKTVLLILIFSASNVYAAEKELVVVFSGDTLGYVEPCG